MPIIYLSPSTEEDILCNIESGGFYPRFLCFFSIELPEDLHLFAQHAQPDQALPCPALHGRRLI